MTACTYSTLLHLVFTKSHYSLLRALELKQVVAVDTL